MIHPTAIIDPSARLGEGVTVGPYCIIGAGVELGADCWLQHHVTILGPSKIGARNRFHAYGSIGQQTQDLKYAGEPTFQLPAPDGGPTSCGTLTCAPNQICVLGCSGVDAGPVDLHRCAPRAETVLRTRPSSTVAPTL